MLGKWEWGLKEEEEERNETLGAPVSVCFPDPRHPPLQCATKVFIDDLDCVSFHYLQLGNQAEMTDPSSLRK